MQCKSCLTSSLPDAALFLVKTPGFSEGPDLPGGAPSLEELCDDSNPQGPVLKMTFQLKTTFQLRDTVEIKPVLDPYCHGFEISERIKQRSAQPRNVMVNLPIPLLVRYLYAQHHADVITSRMLTTQFEKKTSQLKESQSAI